MRPNTPGFFFEMKGIIYKATNTLNGKVYIGQTVGSLAHRRGEHQRDAAGDAANHFHTALYQYPDLFEWEVIDTFHGTREEVFHALNVAEEYHILKYNSTDERFGYNATAGGYSSDKFADYIKQRTKALGGQARAVLQYDADGNFVREFESLNAACAYLEKPKMQGKVLFNDGLHYGYQWREKTSNFFPQEIEPYKKHLKCGGVAVLAYRGDGAFLGRYETRADAFRAAGTSGAIRELDGKPIFLHHHQLRDFYFFKEVPNPPERVEIIEIKKEVKESKPRGVRVAAYTLDGDFIREYESLGDAGRKCGASRDRISHQCKETEPIILSVKSRCKFIWRYSNGNPKPKIEVIDYRPKKVEKMVWRLQPDGTKIRVPVIVTERKAEGRKKKMEHRILQYSLDGVFIKVWENARAASEVSNESYSSIYKQLGGKGLAQNAKSIWKRYSENYPLSIPSAPIIDVREARRKTAIVAYDAKNGLFVAEYVSVSEAHIKSGESESVIYRSASLPEPVRVKSPKQEYVWRKKDGEVKARIDIIPYEAKTIERKKMEHRVIQYSLEGEFIKVWESAYVAGLTSGDTASYIGHSLKGDQRAKAKFIWRHYAEDYPRRIDTAGVSSAAEREREPIVQLNRAGEVIARYADRKEAARATGVSISHVCNIVRGRVRHPSVRLLREDDYKRRYEGQNKGL